MTKNEVRDAIENLFEQVPKLTVVSTDEGAFEPCAIEVSIGVEYLTGHNGSVRARGKDWDEAFDDLMAEVRWMTVTYEREEEELENKHLAYAEAAKKLREITKIHKRIGVSAAERGMEEMLLRRVTMPRPEEILADNAPGSSTPGADPGLQGGVIAMPPATLTEEERAANEKAARVPILPYDLSDLTKEAKG